MSSIAPILKAIIIALDAPTDKKHSSLSRCCWFNNKKVPNKIEVVEHTTKK